MIYQTKVRRRLSRGGLVAIGLLALVVLPGWSHGLLVGQEAEVPGGEAASENTTGATTEEEPKSETRPAASAKARATVQVFVALEDIPVGERITAEMLKLEEWPSDKPPAGIITQLQDVKGLWSLTKIYAGEPIRANLLGRPGEVLVSIPPGYRVVSVPPAKLNATSDLIRPGDRVDVLFAPHDEEDAAEREGRAILENIGVFAVTDSDEPSPGGKHVSLLVTPQQAEELLMATESGRIDLAQRPGTTGWGRPQPPQKTIEVFRLKHRDPAEMMEIVTALFRLVAGKEDLPAREVTVLAVVKAPVGRSGMYGERYGGGMPMGAGMGAMPGGMPFAPGYDEEAYQPGMPSGAMYPAQAPEPRELPELRLAVDRRTSALIARASREGMEIVRKLVAALDTPDDSLPAQIEKLPSLRLVKLRHRKTEDMARVLHELGINVHVTRVPLREEEAVSRFVEGGGTLIAAGGGADLDQIEHLIQALDVEARKASKGGAAVYPGAGAPTVPGPAPAAGTPSRP